MSACTMDDCATTTHARGLCLRHYAQWLRRNNGAKPRRKVTELVSCSGCERPVRPSKRPPSDYPDQVTVAFGSSGKCKTCHKRDRAATTPPVIDLEREARNLAYIERGLASFIARRNARLSKYRLAA